MYALGQRSLQRIEGLHPDLVATIKRAIQLTDQDFTVIQGVRTAAQQAANVASGASQTSNSRHLPGPDGFAYAVDLAAWQNGAISWSASRYPAIADAMRRAAIDVGRPIRYGGGWFQLNDLGSEQDIIDATSAYVARRRAEGARPFLDLGHFELPRSQAYP
jgi:peptidoglycan L-alanyl-D-glutamate endopeptidase CwlK